jgi:sugar/nucleoside kinase (ribokinase family)
VAAPDFVVVGHVTLDHFGETVRPGGTVLYAAVAAHRLGLSAGILTSHGADFPLDAVPPQIEVVTLEAPATTVFEHRHREARRAMRVTSAARPLGPAEVPEDWRDARLVMLAPVVDEVDPALVETFADATVAASAQGWLRRLEATGAVTNRRWNPPRGLLERLQALFVSAEDVRGQESQLTEWLQRLPLAAVTAGKTGALLYVNGERYEVRPRSARMVDPTGAGDVFAAAFMVRYHLEGDPWEAAAAASCAASMSVEGEGWSTVPERPALDAALAAYRAAL